MIALFGSLAACLTAYMIGCIQVEFSHERGTIVEAIFTLEKLHCKVQVLWE